MKTLSFAAALLSLAAVGVAQARVAVPGPEIGSGLVGGAAVVAAVVIIASLKLLRRKQA